MSANPGFWELFFSNIIGVTIFVVCLGWGISWIIQSWRGKATTDDRTFCQCSCGYINSPDDFDRHFRSATQDESADLHKRVK